MVAVGVGVISLMGVAALTATSSSAGDGGRHFIVDKAVEGPLPEGAEFQISFAFVEEGEIPDPSQVVINGPGNAVDALILASKSPVTCTVPEPVDGGATSVTFSCDPGPVATCDADNRVTFPSGDEITEATVTVTNTFAEPTPEPEPAAEAITTEPAFTG